MDIDRYIEENCTTCPPDFPIYDEARLDCADEQGCLRREGVHTLPNGEVRCGKGCPPGWVPLDNGMCKEDVENLCDHCQKAIDQLANWSFDPVGKPYSSTSNDDTSTRTCTVKEAEAVFYDFKNEYMQQFEDAMSRCQKRKRSPRIVQAKKMSTIQVFVTPCVGETVVYNPLADLQELAKRKLLCRVPKEAVDAPAINPEVFSFFFERNK